MTRVDCPVCARSIRLVYHGSGRPLSDGHPPEAYVGVHCSDLGAPSMGGNESLCPGSGRWIPRDARVPA